MEAATEVRRFDTPDDAIDMKEAAAWLDFFEIPPGHDAYDEGSERVELIRFAPPEDGHLLSLLLTSS